MYYLAQGITHRGVGGAYISAVENHPPVCAYLSLGLSQPPSTTFAPFHRTLNPPSGSSLSSPPPSNHPLRARSHSPLPHSSLRCTTAVPRHTLFSLSLPPPPPNLTHPKTPLTPTYSSHPSLYSIPVLYRSRALAPAPANPPSPLPPSGASTHPNANHPLKVGAPYWRLNHPARGRFEGEGMGWGGQRGGRVPD